MRLTRPPTVTHTHRQAHPRRALAPDSVIRKRLPLDSLPLCPTSPLCALQGFTPGLLFPLSTPPVRAKQSRGLAAHLESKEAEQRSHGGLGKRQNNFAQLKFPRRKELSDPRVHIDPRIYKLQAWLRLWWQKWVKNASEPEARPLGRCGPAEAEPASPRALQGLGHHLRSESVQPVSPSPRSPGNPLIWVMGSFSLGHWEA